MPKHREKGKIPHTEWPAIRSRHAAGESLASIARHYECTGPAIRYIIDRLERSGTPGADRPPATADAPRHRQPAAATTPPPAGERQARQAPIIDSDLRRRVSSEIASFLAIFDGCLADNTQESYDQLLEATDRLMRVAARTRIELERARTSPPAAALGRDTRYRSASG